MGSGHDLVDLDDDASGVVGDRPARALQVAGLGLGLLLASAFSTFWWWWAVGAGLFGLVLVGTVIILADR